MCGCSVSYVLYCMHYPNKHSLTLTAADYEDMKTMTGTPISYLAHQPNVGTAVGGNIYPSGSALSYQVSMVQGENMPLYCGKT